jgi:hypothetical protein
MSARTSPFSTPHLLQQLTDRYARTCRHFNGVQHVRCRQGIVYSSVRREGQLACLHAAAAIGCADRSMLSLEESRLMAARRCAELDAAAGHHRAARTAIESMRRRTGSSVGVIPCPKCGSSLHWQRTKNGHVHGRCETEGCVAWME